MIGIYINQTRYVPYAEAIAKGYKTVVTRSRDMLGKLVGKRVAIVRTVRGRKPEVVGYAKIARKTWSHAAELDEMRNETLIPPGSRFDCAGRGMWCYEMASPERCDPSPVPDGKINHGRSYCEFEEAMK